VGSSGVLDAVVKRKIPSFRRESNSRTPIVQPDFKNITGIIIVGLPVKFSPSTMLTKLLRSCCHLYEDLCRISKSRNLESQGLCVNET